MNSIEIFVVIVGAFAGYLLVSHLLRRKPDPATAGSRSGQESSFETPEAQSSNRAVSWEDVLEIPRNSSVEEIRRAYRVQMSKYHPDKVASLGKEFKPIADRKAMEINAAYADAMKHRG